MTSNNTHEFVAPIGGVPYPIDFAPSVLFAILYALLTPITIWRMVNPKTRQFVLIGTLIIGGVDRVVSFSLRAATARNASLRENLNIETYFQTDYSGGFISVGQDLTIIVRALLVNATLGTDMLARYKLDEQRKKEKKKEAKRKKEEAKCKRNKGKGKKDKTNVVVTELEVDSPAEEGESREMLLDSSVSELLDHPRMRFWIRRVCGIATIGFWVTVILGIVSSTVYESAVNSGAHAALVQQLWYGSTGLGLFLIIFTAILAVWASFRVPRVQKSAVLWTVLVAFLLCIVAVYRLVVMQYKTTSLFSMTPHSGNSTGAKIAFYLLQVVPEFLAIAILTILDVRRVFNTGLWGDRRSKDPESS